MKKFATLLVLLAAAFSPSMAYEVPALVIDSGTDFAHSLISPVAFPNEKELSGQAGVDDDKNGYVDDVQGWNFVHDHAMLVDLGDTPPRYDDILTFMEVLGIYQVKGKEGLTPEQFQFLVKNYNDKEFMAWVGFTGGWAHGTHCGGIMSTDNPSIRLKGVTHIQTGKAPEREAAEMLMYFNHEVLAALDGGRGLDSNPIMPQLVEYFKNMGKEAAAGIEREAKYIGSLKPRVINCSFGTDNKSLLAIFKKNMVESWGFKNPTDEEVQELVNLYITHVQVVKDAVFFKYVPEALVVIAAGNSTEDNDKLMISPNDAPIANKLVIAATNNDRSLADFSCFGAEKVDVAVPGVNILSSYPNGKMGYMSGTSMAAPLAARYASMVIAKNPKLTPVEVREILMRTVDKKSWLAGKVKSGGVINVERAVAAAEAIKKGSSLEEAVSGAIEAIPSTELDAPVRKVTFDTDLEKDLYNCAIF